MGIEINGQITNTYQTNQLNKNATVYQSNKTMQDMPVEMKGESAKALGYDAMFKAIEKENGKLEQGEKQFQFSFHEGTKQIMIKVLDKETNEVIKEIPSEKILDMVAKMCEQAGLFVDLKR